MKRISMNEWMCMKDLHLFMTRTGLVGNVCAAVALSFFMRFDTVWTDRVGVGFPHVGSRERFVGVEFYMVGHCIVLVGEREHKTERRI